MSSGLMDTEPGGEQTQYESIQTVTKPTKKSGGQFGEPETEVDESSSAAAEAKTARGEQTAENIRYGQSISEFGMGGQTTTSSGSANNEGGYGGTSDQTQSAESGRSEQGYEGNTEHDPEIGA